MSRIVDLLNAIKTGQQYTEITQSRAEAILKSIANETENLVSFPDGKTSELLSGQDITLATKGKTVSISCLLNCSNVTGAGARLRLDITNNGTTTNSFSNIISGGNVGESKAENISIPATATRVVLYVQTFSSNVGSVEYSNIMVNVGATAKGYIPFIVQPRSRYEELLADIKNGTTTTLTPQSRLEDILIALANETPPPTDLRSELEIAFVEAFIDVSDAYQIGDRLFILNVPATQIGDVISI